MSFVYTLVVPLDSVLKCRVSYVHIYSNIWEFRGINYSVHNYWISQQQCKYVCISRFSYTLGGLHNDPK